MRSSDGEGRRDRRTSTRRKLLGVVGLAAVGGVAGCSGITEQRFAAQSVGLSESVQEELGLAEVSNESESVSRKGPTGNVTVTVTNQAAIYSRASGLGGE